MLRYEKNIVDNCTSKTANLEFTFTIYWPITFSSKNEDDICYETVLKKVLRYIYILDNDNRKIYGSGIGAKCFSLPTYQHRIKRFHPFTFTSSSSSNRHNEITKIGTTRKRKFSEIPYGLKKENKRKNIIRRLSGVTESLSSPPPRTHYHCQKYLVNIECPLMIRSPINSMLSVRIKLSKNLSGFSIIDQYARDFQVYKQKLRSYIGHHLKVYDITDYVIQYIFAGYEISPTFSLSDIKLGLL